MDTIPSPPRQSNNRAWGNKAMDLSTSVLIIAFAACIVTYTLGFSWAFPPLSLGPNGSRGDVGLEADPTFGGNVRHVTDGHLLARSAKLAGHLDMGRTYRADGRVMIAISGWALNRDRPYEPLRICLFQNGKVLCAATTWERNVGVDRTFGTRNAHVGFGLRVPVETVAGPCNFRVIAVGPDDTYVELDASPGCRLANVTPGQAG